MAHLPPCTNLYVRYVPLDWTDKELNLLFGPYGKIVSTRIMLDAATNQSRGLAFVRYEQISEAKAALDALEGFKPEGAPRGINVQFAKSDPLQTNKAPSPYEPYSAPAAVAAPSQDVNYSNLYVVNIPLTMTKEELTKMFEPYGHIQSTVVLADPKSGASRGIGFVKFSTNVEATAAMDAMNGTHLPGAPAPMHIRYAKAEGSSGKLKKGETPAPPPPASSQNDAGLVAALAAQYQALLNQVNAAYASPYYAAAATAASSLTAQQPLASAATAPYPYTYVSPYAAAAAAPAAPATAAAAAPAAPAYSYGYSYMPTTPAFTFPPPPESSKRQ